MSNIVIEQQEFHKRNLLDNENKKKETMSERFDGNLLMGLNKNSTKGKAQEEQSNIKQFNKSNYLLTETPPSDSVTQNFDDDGILYINLHETISTDSNNTLESNVFEENSLSNLGQIFEATGNATSRDEQEEHVVIKKVLDVQETIDDSFVTTIYPLLENQLFETSTEYSNYQNKTDDIKAYINITLEKEALIETNESEIELIADTTYIDISEENISTTEVYINLTWEKKAMIGTNESEIELITDSTDISEENISTTEVYINFTWENEAYIETNESEIKLITDSTYTDISEENISTTEVNTNYQLTETIEQSERDYTDKNLVELSSSESGKQNFVFVTDAKQEDLLKSSERFISKNESNELHNEQLPKKEVKSKDYKEHLNDETYTCNYSMETTEKSESGFNLIQHAQSSDKTNHEKHSNQNIILLNSENIRNQIEISNNNDKTEAFNKYDNNDISKNIHDKEQESSMIPISLAGFQSVSRQIIQSPFDNTAATLFEAYPPQDVGQTFNDNLADESAGIGRALPVSVIEGSNRSTVIIILSSGTAFLFIVISVFIFLVSFQRQHGTLDIELQERNCGKDDLDEDHIQTFAKLLDVKLPPTVVVALDESEEFL